MNGRDKALVKSWMGEITLGGKTLRPIGAGQAVVLSALENGYVTEGKEPSANDMVEIIMVMAMGREEIIRYLNKAEPERKTELALFASEHIDELDGVIQQVAESLARLGNSVMESDAMGKEIRHAS